MKTETTSLKQRAALGAAIPVLTALVLVAFGGCREQNSELLPSKQWRVTVITEDGVPFSFTSIRRPRVRDTGTVEFETRSGTGVAYCPRGTILVEAEDLPKP